MIAKDIITALNLAPHPEGGWYRELWRSDVTIGGNTDYAADRASATAIYFLLETGQRSQWHCVDAHELWLWHAGDPLTLSIRPQWDEDTQHSVLGTDLAAGQQPQIRIPANHWQAAEPVRVEGGAGYTLVSCIVSPGFEFSGFEMR